MFTGLVEGMGKVSGFARRDGAARLGVDVPWDAGTMRHGESVAVDGVCLTVVATNPRGFQADVIAETLGRTTLGALRVGLRVNLERALRVGDALGGHLVQGHVDGVARVAAVRRAGADHRLRLELPPELRRYVAFKGSVALAGVSLTVSAVDERGFEVALIPETLGATTLGKVRPGDRLNVEVDLVARYLERLIPGSEVDRDG
jgi:riboflavin synthase